MFCWTIFKTLPPYFPSDTLLKQSHWTQWMENYVIFVFIQSVQRSALCRFVLSFSGETMWASQTEKPLSWKLLEILTLFELRADISVFIPKMLKLERKKAVNAESFGRSSIPFRKWMHNNAK